MENAKPDIEIQEGMILVCDTLRWNDGWEFDCPSMMLSPVIRCFEDASTHERIVESVMIDAVVGGKLKTQDFRAQWAWRGYKLPVLRRRFREALAGKKFPLAQYHAERETVKIIRDERGRLAWETVPSN